MRELALTQLSIANRDTYIFQRRDGNTKISPHRISWFGAVINEGEEPVSAVIQALRIQTSLDVSELVFSEPDVYEVPARYSSSKELVKVHLFKTILKASQIDFEVKEGTRTEIYTSHDLLATNEVASTVRNVLEQMLTRPQLSVD
jgi:hypothetical protein